MTDPHPPSPLFSATVHRLSPAAPLTNAETCFNIVSEAIEGKGVFPVLLLAAILFEEEGSFSHLLPHSGFTTRRRTSLPMQDHTTIIHTVNATFKLSFSEVNP